MNILSQTTQKKVLTDEKYITKRLFQTNAVHLSMSGDSPVAIGKLASDIGYDGEGEVVEEMLRGVYTIDTTGMDEVYASNEMKIFSGIEETRIRDIRMTG